LSDAIAEVPDELRLLARHVLLDIAAMHRHADLDGLFPALGLPSRGEVDETKAQRAETAVASLGKDCGHLLQRVLDRGLISSPEQRYRVEEALWGREAHPNILGRTRREIATALGPLMPIWRDEDNFMGLLEQLWVLETSTDVWTGHSLRGEIEQHVFRNPEDWSVSELFKRLGAYECTDRRFALFIEGVLSGLITPQEQHQRAMAAAITPELERAGLKLVEIAGSDGYPSFALTKAGVARRPPQLILFAARATKPDLRLSAVLDQQVELMDKDDDVLRYDRPVSAEKGLTWHQLQRWWGERHDLDSVEAKGSLWQRLLTSLPENSPPQQALFTSFHRLYGGRTDFPALLPEVWVHWDPASRSQRKDQAFLNQRMDFLMLLPHGRRIVLEVDGAQHYSADGKASPTIYANTTRGDRDLRLSGYEVFRFSGYELSEPRAEGTVREFFDRLLASN
jgi:hypothetical protein